MRVSTMPNDDDEDRTPTESPSAMHRLGLATCPKCDGGRFIAGVTCPFCEGGGRVTLTRHHEYVGLKDTDPSALRLDVDPESEP